MSKSHAVLQAFGIKKSEGETELKEWVSSSSSASSATRDVTLPTSVFFPANFGASSQSLDSVKESDGFNLDLTFSERLAEALLNYPLEGQERLNYFKSQAGNFTQHTIRVALSLLHSQSRVEAALSYYYSNSDEAKNTPLEYILPILIPAERFELCQQMPARIENPARLDRWLKKEDVKKIFEKYSGKGQQFVAFEEFVALFGASPQAGPFDAFVKVKAKFVEADVACALAFLPVADRPKAVDWCFKRNCGMAYEELTKPGVSDLVQSILLPSQSSARFKQDSKKIFIEQTWAYDEEFKENLADLSSKEVAECVLLQKKKLKERWMIYAVLEKLPSDAIAAFFKQYIEELYGDSDFDKNMRKARVKMPDADLQDFDDFIASFKEQRKLSKEKIIAGVKSAGLKIANVASDLATEVKDVVKQVPELFAKKETGVVGLPNAKDNKEEILPLYGDIFLAELAGKPEGRKRRKYFESQVHRLNRRNLVFALTLLSFADRLIAVNHYENTVAEENQIGLESIMPVIHPAHRLSLYAQKEYHLKARTMSPAWRWLAAWWSKDKNISPEEEELHAPKLDVLKLYKSSDAEIKLAIDKLSIRSVFSLLVPPDSVSMRWVDTFEHIIARNTAFEFTEDQLISIFLLLVPPEEISQILKKYSFAWLDQSVLKAMIALFPPSNRLQMIKELMLDKSRAEVEPLLPWLMDNDQAVVKFLYQIWEDESQFLAVVDLLSAEQMDECLALRPPQVTKDWVVFGIAERLPVNKKIPFLMEHSVSALDSSKFDERVDRFAATFSGPAWVDCINYISTLRKQREAFILMKASNTPLNVSNENIFQEVSLQPTEVKFNNMPAVSGQLSTHFFSPKVSKVTVVKKRRNLAVSINRDAVVEGLSKCSEAIEQEEKVSQRLVYFKANISSINRKNILVALSLLPRKEKMAAVISYYNSDTAEARETTLESIYPVFLPMDLLVLYAEYPKKLKNFGNFVKLLNKEDRSEALIIQQQGLDEYKLTAKRNDNAEKYNGFLGLIRFMFNLKSLNADPLECFKQTMTSFGHADIVCALSFLPLGDRSKAIIEYLFSADGIHKSPPPPLPDMLNMLLPSERRKTKNEISMFMFVRQLWRSEKEMLSCMVHLKEQQVSEGVKLHLHVVTDDWAIFAILDRLPPKEIRSYFVEHEACLVQSPLFATRTRALQARVPEEEWREFSAYLDDLRKQQCLQANASTASTSILADVANGVSAGMRKIGMWVATKVVNPASAQSDSAASNNVNSSRPGVSPASSQSES